jgi:hypothetical protein
MIGLRSGVAVAAIACMLTACVAPAGPGAPRLPERGADTHILYFPRIARSPVQARQYLPRIARQSGGKLFLPAVKKAYPACAILGADCGEPNDTRAQAFGLTEFNRPYFGTVYTATADAYDYFAANLIPGKRYTVTLSGGEARGSPFAGQGDADLYLYDAAGVMLIRSAGYGSGAETILYTPTVSGQFFILAYAYDTPDGPAAYRLEVRDIP